MVTDGTRTRLSVLLYAFMFVLPVVALAIGWIVWDFRAGVVAALAIFALCFILAGVLLATVKDISWLAVGLPFALGVSYVASPDWILGSLDDAVVISAGSLMTFALWLRKQPDTPKWIVIPLLFAGVYTLVGSAIPGPVDELLVTVISAGTAAYGGARKQLPGSDAPLEEGADFIEGEVLEEGEGA